MDYLKIVLDGYCNPTDKKFLKEYFIRESKKAEAEFYSPEIFLTGCKDAVQTYLINDLYRQKSDARKELLEARQWAKEHDQELFNRTYEQEDNLNIENYTVNLWHLTNGRYTGHMDYFEIMHISDTLDLLISIDNLIDEVKNIQPTTTGTGTEPTFKDLLITDDVRKQQIIDKIRPLPMSKPKDVFLILAALIEQKIILETERSKIYTAFADEFNYSKSIKSLESSCNNHFAKKSEGDKGYNTQIKNIENHLFD